MMGEPAPPTPQTPAPPQTVDAKPAPEKAQPVASKNDTSKNDSAAAASAAASTSESMDVAAGATVAPTKDSVANDTTKASQPPAQDSSETVETVKDVGSEETAPMATEA